MPKTILGIPVEPNSTTLIRKLYRRAVRNREPFISSRKLASDAYAALDLKDQATVTVEELERVADEICRDAFRREQQRIARRLGRR